MSCLQNEPQQLDYTGSLKDFVVQVFSQPAMDPCELHLDVSSFGMPLESFLTNMLCISLNHLYNVTNLKDITLDMFEHVQKYFHSFGYNIVYNQVIVDGTVAYDIGFETLPPTF